MSQCLTLTLNLSRSCCSYTLTLTPAQEDVIYALTEDDALAEVCSNTSSSSSSMVSRDKMVYLMTPEGSPTATMTYLRSLYCQGHHAAGQNQWGAFVERLRGMAAQRGIDAASIPADVSEVRDRRVWAVSCALCARAVL